MCGIFGACAGSFLGSLCCGACGQCTPDKENRFGKASRLPYLFLVILSGIFAVIMSEYGETELDLEFYSRKICETNCSGNGSVYRISFILFVFEAIHLFIVPFVHDFHWMCFGLKFIAFVVAIILVFTIDDGAESSNEFFNDYADHFARYVSILYLLVQIVIIIDWMWMINEYTQERLTQFTMSRPSADDTNENCSNPWVTLRAVLSIGALIFALVFIILFYVWFGGDDCHTHNTLISVTLIICVINVIAAGIAGGGSLPTAALMSVYCVFLLFSALKSSHSEECNDTSSGTDLAMWVGIIFALIMLCVASMRADLMEGAFDVSGIGCCSCWCPASAAETDDDDEDSIDENAGLATESRKKRQKIATGGDSEDEENVVELGIIDDDGGKGGKGSKGRKGSKNKEKASDADPDIEDDDDARSLRLQTVSLDVGDAGNAGARDTSDAEANGVQKKQKQGKGKDGNKSEEELESEKQIRNTIFFHLILTFTSCYMSMLFTDWGTSSDISTLGDVSQWVNIGVQWVSVALYWLSLFNYYQEQRWMTQEH